MPLVADAGTSSHRDPAIGHALRQKPWGAAARLAGGTWQSRICLRDFAIVASGKERTCMDVDIV